MADSPYQQAQQLYNDFKTASDKDPEKKVPNSIIETINVLLESARQEEPESVTLKKLSKLDPVDTKYIEARVLLGQILTAIEVNQEEKQKNRPYEPSEE